MKKKKGKPGVTKRGEETRARKKRKTRDGWYEKGRLQWPKVVAGRVQKGATRSNVQTGRMRLPKRNS